MEENHFSENDIREALAKVCVEYIDLKLLGTGQEVQVLSDSTMKFVATARDHSHKFMLISGAGNVKLMERAVSNIHDVRSRLSASVAVPILAPLSSGEVLGRSFAIWDFKRPFADQNRLKTFINRRIYAGPIVDWLAAFGRETLTSATPEVVVDDLLALINDENLSTEVRDGAKKALDKLSVGLWKPYHCFQHGDFWQGNLLLATHDADSSFYIVDWAGMSQKGYPFMDLTRLLMSINLTKFACRRYLSIYDKQIGIDKSESAMYTLSALGNLRKNLENFPSPKFRELTEAANNFVIDM